MTPLGGDTCLRTTPEHLRTATKLPEAPPYMHSRWLGAKRLSRGGARASRKSRLFTRGTPVAGGDLGAEKHRGHGWSVRILPLP